jgi:hypothetical protein
MQYKKEIIEGGTKKVCKTEIITYAIYKIKSILNQSAKLKGSLFYLSEYFSCKVTSAAFSAVMPLSF